MTTDRVERVEIRTPTATPRVLGGISLVTIALFAAYSGVLGVLLPQQVEALDPQGKIASLAFVTSLSFAVTAFAQPLIGALSDRTSSRWGRRVPWMAAGAVVGGIALGFAGGASSVAVLAIAWAVAQFALNGTDIASSAYLVDRFPPHRRGGVAAVMGVAVVVGGAAGILLAGRLSSSPWMAYLLLGAGVLVAVLIFAAVVRDPPSVIRLPRRSRRAFVAEFRTAFREHPDFVRVLVWRASFTLAYVAVHGYLLYLLTDYIGLAAPDARGLMALLTVVGGVAVVVSLLAGGWLSDRLQRRKPFLLVAAVLVVVGNIAAYALPTVAGVFLLAAAFGCGLGLSIACGTALGSEVIPDPQSSAARGLGTLNLAGNVGQALAPVVGAMAISLTGDYRSLFVLSTGFVVVATIILMTYRGSR